MLTMRYQIQLPADYAMSAIEKRIAERGHLTDGLPGLAFKAYLYGAKGDEETRSASNSYAPFYLWRRAEGMRDFLSGPGFAGLCEAFGRPAVEGGLAWCGEWREDVPAARFAMVERLPLDAGLALESERAIQADWRRRQLAAPDVLAAVAGFDPAGWALTRLLLLRGLPAAMPSSGALLYRVGRISPGGRD
ncbi:DUF4865 family protein [Chromobacterium sphagni]|uniref:DUF4865 domain-containing protein n=1 Tax=Chromobacterium sphagni TaxID=1903179 RepID=A0A1S1X1Q9_9NEIS|nr:DUF4865 family protein [Chromobacterium sphagni]OHX13330.1 hypothetical protein BI347_07275 [Chromobacterium sphagni]OHX17039.1 hypothetical protein BI344_12310 [Chromobacterium sphagni]